MGYVIDVKTDIFDEVMANLTNICSDLSTFLPEEKLSDSVSKYGLIVHTSMYYQYVSSFFLETYVDLKVALRYAYTLPINVVFISDVKPLTINYLHIKIVQTDI